MQFWFMRTAKPIRSASRSPGLVGEGGEGGEDAGIAALGEVAHDGDEELFLVAMVIVDGLARDAGLGRDQVDIGAGEAFAAEHVSGSIDDRQALGLVAAWRENVRRNVELHRKSI